MIEESVLRGLLEEWRLTPDGEARPTGTGAVQNVRTEAGRACVLKLGAAAHEHLALQRWRGSGAVLMLRADPARGALLLERLQDQDLSEHWDLDACEIVAGLYPHLHVRALPRLPRLSELSELAEGWARAGRGLGAATSTTTIHGDLHHRHVLAGQRPSRAEHPRQGPS